MARRLLHLLFASAIALTFLSSNAAAVQAYSFYGVGLLGTTYSSCGQMDIANGAVETYQFNHQEVFFRARAGDPATLGFIVEGYVGAYVGLVGGGFCGISVGQVNVAVSASLACEDNVPSVSITVSDGVQSVTFVGSGGVCYEAGIPD
jgi:hypothetical protein